MTSESLLQPDELLHQPNIGGGDIPVTAENPADPTGAIVELAEAAFPGEAPDAVFSFAGGIKQRPNSEDYRTLAYSELGEHGLVTGSKIRVIATAAVARAIPGVPVVANSFNRFNPNEPTMASVVKKELVSRGIGAERIVLEEESFSTITQLIEMVNLAVANQWARVAVVGNSWHFPRLTRMYNQLDTIVHYEDPAQDALFREALASFREAGVRVSFVSSEAVARATNSKYGAYLDAVEQTEAFQKTLEAEARGVADLDAGTYRVTLKAEQPRK